MNEDITRRANFANLNFDLWLWQEKVEVKDVWEMTVKFLNITKELLKIDTF